MRGEHREAPLYECISTWGQADVRVRGLRVISSRDDLQRSGEVVVCLRNDDRRTFGQHAIMRPASAPSGGSGLAILVAAHRDERLPPGTVAVDQVGRNARGTELGEEVGVIGKLGTVRMRCSRGYQVLTEMRESLFLVLLALVGLASRFPRTVTRRPSGE